MITKNNKEQQRTTKNHCKGGFKIIFPMKFATIVLLAGLVLAGCKKEEAATSDSGLHRKLSEVPQSDEEIILGDSINDPYRIDNMRAAYNSLVNEGVTPNVPSIEPNYRYVKILPDNEAGLDNLEADTNLLMFDFPLHYEIAVNGVYYHDPSVPDSALTWLYAVVPCDYVFPGGSIVHDIYEVFIPEEQNEFYDLLEARSYVLTGNIADNEDRNVNSAAAQSRSTSYYPSATIRVYDDVAEDYIPVQGAKVTARYCTKTASGITDAYGYCTVNKSFKYAVNYAIKWERAYWDIREGAWGQAYYNGPKQNMHWNLDISGGKSLSYATIHSAAMKHYYGNNLGLRRPILSVGKTKISYYHEPCESSEGMYIDKWNVFGVFPNIKIWGYKNSGIPQNTNDIYGITAHELGHMVHKKYVGNTKFSQTNTFIKESWAQVVAWALTNHHYNVELSQYNLNYNHDNGCRQNWYPRYYIVNLEPDYYTPVFADLIDDYNQRNSSTSYPNDMISGYSILEIQNLILGNTTNLASLKSTLKANKRHGTTNSQIDSLLVLYYNMSMF